MPEFQQAFSNDAACAVYLEKLRWPKRSSVVLRCRSCKINVSLTAGTSMQGAVNTVPPTYEQLYSGEWQHAA